MAGGSALSISQLEQGARLRFDNQMRVLQQMVTARNTLNRPPQPVSTRPSVLHAAPRTPGLKTALAAPHKGPTPAFRFAPRTYRGTALEPRRAAAAGGVPVATPASVPGSGLVQASSISTTTSADTTTTEPSTSSLLPLLVAGGVALYSLS